MSVLLLPTVGVITGMTTVLFGFGGGFVTVPVMVWASASLGVGAATVAVATSSVMMVVNAAVATAATPRTVLDRLRHTTPLLALLAMGGAIGAPLARLAAPPLISWGFIAYLLITIVDALIRPGFIRPGRRREQSVERFAIPPALGVPIGAIASFLDVGGSVMTVPLLRRSGLGMRVAASLANPLTLAISLPACLIFLLTRHPMGGHGARLVGTVDLRGAALLLAGAIPVVILMRRRPPRLPDRVHAWGYLALLIVVLAGMVLSTIV